MNFRRVSVNRDRWKVACLRAYHRRIASVENRKKQKIIKHWKLVYIIPDSFRFFLKAEIFLRSFSRRWKRDYSLKARLTHRESRTRRKYVYRSRAQEATLRESVAEASRRPASPTIVAVSSIAIARAYTLNIAAIRAARAT